MAWWQFLFFRKKPYRRRVSQDSYKKRQLRHNIVRKRKQVKRAKWGICTSLWLIPFSGAISGLNAIRHTRKLHIAVQKKRILETEWEKRYPDEDIEKVLPKKPWLKRFADGVRRTCGCLCGCVKDEFDDIESVVKGDLEGSILGVESLGHGNSSIDVAGAIEDGMERGREADEKSEIQEEKYSTKTSGHKAQGTKGSTKRRKQKGRNLKEEQIHSNASSSSARTSRSRASLQSIQTAASGDAHSLSASNGSAEDISGVRPSATLNLASTTERETSTADGKVDAAYDEHDDKNSGLDALDGVVIGAAVATGVNGDYLSGGKRIAL